MHPLSSQGGQKGVFQQGNIWSEILMEFEESYAVFEARVSVQVVYAAVLETARRGEYSIKEEEDRWRRGSQRGG